MFCNTVHFSMLVRITLMDYQLSVLQSFCSFLPLLLLCMSFSTIRLHVWCPPILTNYLTRPVLKCELHFVSGQQLLQTCLTSQLGMSRTDSLALSFFLSICLGVTLSDGCPWFVLLTSSWLSLEDASVLLHACSVPQHARANTQVSKICAIIASCVPLLLGNVHEGFICM